MREELINLLTSSCSEKDFSHLSPGEQLFHLSAELLSADQNVFSMMKMFLSSPAIPPTLYAQRNLVLSAIKTLS